MVLQADPAPPAGTPESELAAALGLAPAAAAGLTWFGAVAAHQVVDTLGRLFGQPVSIGGLSVHRLSSGEIERENWDLYHPIDVRWEVNGATYSPLLLVPKGELQTLLPAARGSADLPDMEALGNLLRDLADRVSAELLAVAPVRISLPDAHAPDTADPSQAQLRVEHRISVGDPGAATELTVIHLIPVAAFQAVLAVIPVMQQPDPMDPLGAEPGSGAGTSDSYSTTAFSAGGETRTMEDPMATGPAAAQPAGTSVHPVQFQPFEGEMEPHGGTNLDLLLDVSLKVSVELGRTDLTVKDVLALGPGSVIELDKLAGEPVDILVNGALIAKGEVVVVDENFGVRVTDIVSPQRRVGKLR